MGWLRFARDGLVGNQSKARPQHPSMAQDWLLIGYCINILPLALTNFPHARCHRSNAFVNAAVTDPLGSVLGIQCAEIVPACHSSLSLQSSSSLPLADPLGTAPSI